MPTDLDERIEAAARELCKWATSNRPQATCREILRKHFSSPASEPEELPNEPGVWERWGSGECIGKVVVLGNKHELEFSGFLYDVGWVNKNGYIERLHRGGWRKAVPADGELERLTKENAELREELKKSTRETLDLILKETNTTIEEADVAGTPFDTLRKMVEERNRLRDEFERVKRESGELHSSVMDTLKRTGAWGQLILPRGLLGDIQNNISALAAAQQQIEKKESVESHP